MGLRTEAESVLSEILEDTTLWAWPITVKDPTGKTESMTGRSTDISQVIDPDTGAVVSGRAASVALRISSIIGLGFTSLPRGIADTASKPWLITFNDINGTSIAFKIIQTNPDRAVGIVTCHLELYTV